MTDEVIPPPKRTRRKKVVVQAEEPVVSAVTEEVPVHEQALPAVSAPVPEEAPMVPPPAEPLQVNLVAAQSDAPIFPRSASPAQNPFAGALQASAARTRNILWALGVLLVGGVAIISGTSYWERSQLRGEITAPISEKRANAIIARVDRLVFVPAGETPTLSVIRDAEGLAQQYEFYRAAKDGQVLVIYSDRAILYDPKSDKIVAMGPLRRSNGSADASPSPTPEASPSGTPAASPAVTPTPLPLTVDVRNGTGTAGKAKAAADQIRSANTLFKIGSVGDASKAYTVTVIVDQSKGKNPALVAQLETLLGVKAQSTMPKGERAASADILVLIGK